MEYRTQGAGCRWSARRVSDAASVRGIVRKHDCALPTLHPKHSNTSGAITTVRVRVRVGARARARVQTCLPCRYPIKYHHDGEADADPKPGRWGMTSLLVVVMQTPSLAAKLTPRAA